MSHYEPPFIGLGHNPDGPDLPTGFGTQLAQHPRALEQYGMLGKQDKEAVVRYIKDCRTGDEAAEKIMTAIQKLSEGNAAFFH